MKSVKDRIYSRIEKTTGCWIWKGHLNKDGFGKIMINRKVDQAHRLSYLNFVGPISDGEFVVQKCGNKNCVNPEHLYLSGRFWGNQHSGKTHCKRGHELTGKNLIQTKTQRICKVCHSESIRKYTLKKKIALMSPPDSLN